MATVRDKLDHIYTDIEANVTRIFGRRNLHLVIDAVYHAPLYFFFDGAMQRAFPELFILGDTRCGKSQIATALVNHYQMGRVVSCENTSHAGLIGGIDKEFGSKNVIKWGVIPMNHKRLLFLDEVSSLPENTIADMSLVRSAGMAEINKIKSQRTNARTRLVWMSNPKSRHKINSQTYAIAHIQKLIKNPEDIARFDFMIVVEENDVDNELINQLDRPIVEHTYTTELARDLVLWCWSRSPYQVEFTRPALELDYALSKKMYEKYNSIFPLVIPAEQKLKLARVAIGIAGRLFSCDETGEILVVKPEHVQTAYDVMNELYDSEWFGYDQWSCALENVTTLSDEQIEAIEEILYTEFNASACQHLATTNYMTYKDFEEIAGLDQTIAKPLVSKLLQHGAYRKHSSKYVKTPGLNRILKRITKNDRLDPKIRASKQNEEY